MSTTNTMRMCQLESNYMFLISVTTTQYLHTEIHFLGSAADRGLSPVEWGDFLSILGLNRVIGSGLGDQYNRSFWAGLVLAKKAC